MEKHLKLSDLIFEEQFKNLNLDPSIFTHEAHIRLAYIHLKKYGIQQAIQNICNQLFSFSSFIEKKHKYNEEMTISAIRIVFHFMNQSKSNNFKEFIYEFPQLKNNFNLLISSYRINDLIPSQSISKTNTK